jgi:hypothetical protein
MGGVIFGELDDLLAEAREHLPADLHAKIVSKTNELKAAVGKPAAGGEAQGTQAP